MKIALFIPCLVDQFYPEIGESVVEILEQLDLEFDYPEAQTCCGLPFYNMGHWDAAQRPAQHFMDVFEGYDAIVTPSSSCAAMAKHFIPNLYEKDLALKARASRIASKTHELCSFIVNEVEMSSLGAKFNGSVACHRSCHLREIDARDEAESLISHVEGAQFVPLTRSDVCCGFGGAFSIKFPVLSGALGGSKCDTLDECDADCVVTTDAGCMLQINGILHRRGEARRVWRIAELLTNRVRVE